MITSIFERRLSASLVACQPSFYFRVVNRYGWTSCFHNIQNDNFVSTDSSNAPLLGALPRNLDSQILPAVQAQTRMTALPQTLFYLKRRKEVDEVKGGSTKGQWDMLEGNLKMHCKEVLLKFIGIIPQSWGRHRWKCHSCCLKMQQNCGGSSKTDRQTGWCPFMSPLRWDSDSSFLVLLLQRLAFLPVQWCNFNNQRGQSLVLGSHRWAVHSAWDVLQGCRV